MSRTDIQFPPEHAALKEDVHALGELIGEILREQGGQRLFGPVERIRRAAIAHREGVEPSGPGLAAAVEGQPPDLARDLVRAFSMWFRTVNLAEKVHRIRRRREYFRSNAHPQPGGVASAIAQLKSRGLGLHEVLKLVSGLHIEPVFAAHALSATRRTLLRKQLRVSERLLALNPTLTSQEQRDLWSDIRFELTTAWQTEDVPRRQLTVGDEREQALFYLMEILYPVVPAFYEEIAQAIGTHYQVPAESIELPCILSFGSWVGGDMDSNPDVHAKTVRETFARHQRVIVNAYYTEAQRLAERLSQSDGRTSVSGRLTQRIEDYMRLAPGARAPTPGRRDRMPYRLFLTQIAARLQSTYEGRATGYDDAQQLRDDVQIIADSLQANNGEHAGLFHIRRFLRRIDTFGFHLAGLDVRQHASVLHRIIAQASDDPIWTSRASAERTRLLAAALNRDAGPRLELDALGKRNLAVFEAFAQIRHRYGPRAAGLFVVSGTEGPDDVLAALLLARWASVYDKNTDQVTLDIAPQFESIAALERSGEIVGQLLAEPAYRRHIEARSGFQGVLIGYSDSNKEVGPCASRFAIHQAQAALAATIGAAGKRYTLMHVRGGSLPRGGGRIDSVVKSAPAQAINGVLRLREQGETISKGYGLRPLAMRTLERAFNALSLLGGGGDGAPPAAHLECAATLAAASREAYRRLVYDQGDFYQFFHAITPIDVIETMQVGSRTLHREEGAGLEGLLPVPWVFAWSLTRHMLPGWYGAGAGLAAAIERHGLERLRAACAQWPFFGTLVDDIEASLARADLAIAAAYDVLVPQRLRPFAATIRAEYERTREQVLRVKDAGELLAGDPMLQRTIRLRNPYIDPMNLMQVDLLARWRAGGRTDRDLLEALLASASGIAQGLQSIA